MDFSILMAHYLPSLFCPLQLLSCWSDNLLVMENPGIQAVYRRWKAYKRYGSLWILSFPLSCDTLNKLPIDRLFFKFVSWNFYIVFHDISLTIYPVLTEMMEVQQPWKIWSGCRKGGVKEVYRVFKLPKMVYWMTNKLLVESFFPRDRGLWIQGITNMIPLKTKQRV